MDLIEYLTRSRLVLPCHRSVSEKQSVEALSQLYGYMTFNDNMYGILSNLNRAWFFRRVETTADGTLECARIELSGGPTTMLKAFVGIVLLAEKHCTPTMFPAPSNRYFDSSSIKAKQERRRAVIAAKKYTMVPVNGTYPCLSIDFRLCNWERSSIRHTEHGSCVVHAHFPRAKEDEGELAVVCKLVDTF